MNACCFNPSMKIMNVEATADVDITLPPEVLKQIPPDVGILTTVQHLQSLDSIKTQLAQAKILGQVLGCDASQATDAEAYLYIGSGRFHPIEIKRHTGKDVYTYNPFTKELSTITDDELEALERRKYAAYATFLHARTIGILVSTKPGQKNLEKARALKARLEKTCYILMGDMLTPQEAENFPFIDCFVNTACPRIRDDSFPRPIIDIRDLEQCER
ncbi:MAG: diphthamide synthesis protein [Nanobdellota archaeon]